MAHMAGTARVHQVHMAGTAPSLAEDDDRVLGDDLVDLLLQGCALFRRLWLAGEHGPHRRSSSRASQSPKAARVNIW